MGGNRRSLRNGGDGVGPLSGVARAPVAGEHLALVVARGGDRQRFAMRRTDGVSGGLPWSGPPTWRAAVTDPIGRPRDLSGGLACQEPGQHSHRRHAVGWRGGGFQRILELPQDRRSGSRWTRSSGRWGGLRHTRRVASRPRGTVTAGGPQNYNVKLTTQNKSTYHIVVGRWPTRPKVARQRRLGFVPLPA